ncbi:PREDICTED: spermatogenesis-associated serine-rich protein 2-like [Pseudopodoces humilis]|uniref:spermatogenesis-associated serine-rich protein 2-like n=1 Tax=Pseudopodoces humilis TaxID=181119 RepID=UPI0006B824D7|nr:PREDICTED: spermatogenesis-associated serine-rich protein 2-like [Pseudopodoces humilis]
MSRKQQPKDSLGFIFDVRSGAVRAQGGCSENMKEKVQAVRAVVPQRSTTEILLVLQHFDNAVDSAVQAFMEGNASEVLKEWTVTGKKKNKKKKPKAKSQPGSDPAGKSQPGEEGNWEKSGKPGISQNGFHGNGAESPEPLGESPQGGAALGNGIPAFPAQSRSDPGGKKLGAGLEKSRKELRRCGAALARCRALLREELQGSLRRLRAAFSDIHACLMDREVALLAEMDKVKAEAMELLALRQRRAEALRELTEAAPGMSEEQLLELRADIKHFVSERKLDEELGRAGRFGCDLDALRGSIGAFGQVSHPRPSYSSRSRCSSGPAFPAGSAPEFPEFPAGSAPEFPEFPAGSAPEFPKGSAAPTEPPQPPGIPEPPGLRSRPGVREAPGKLRGSRPEGANS